MKLSVLIMLLQVVFASSCFSQADKEKKYLKENFIAIDSSCKNEMDLMCDVYGSKSSKSLFMQVCYWDSLKTKIASRHIKENGKYNGPCSYWTPDGYLTMEGAYKNDRKDGNWIYFSGKKIISEGKFTDGKKVGIWKEYDQNGKSKKEIDYGGREN